MSHVLVCLLVNGRKDSKQFLTKQCVGDRRPFTQADEDKLNSGRVQTETTRELTSPLKVLIPECFVCSEAETD